VGILQKEQCTFMIISRSKSS